MNRLGGIQSSARLPLKFSKSTRFGP